MSKERDSRQVSALDWVDPFADQKSVSEPPRRPRRGVGRRAMLAVVAAAAAAAALVAAAVAVWHVPQQLYHRYVTCDSNNFGDGEPAWSPDGRRIAVGLGGDILVVNAHTGTVRRLTRGHCGGDAEPTWSPDGTRLAFDDGHGGIATIQSDGTGRKRIVAGGHAPSWSPDGRWILYATNPSDVPFSQNPSYLYVIHPDGRDRWEIDTSDTSVLDASWSPDGHRIAFEGDPKGLYLARFPGGGNEPIGGCTYPAWAPTGDRIATICKEIRIVDIRNRSATDLPGTSANRPAWSPDGTRLAFYNGSTKSLYVMQADGSDRQLFANLG